MATIEELNVKISADVKGLRRGVNKANSQLKGLGKRAKKSTKELDKGLKGLGNRFQNLASSVAIVQGPLGGVAGRFGAIGALIKRVNVLTLASIGIFTAFSVVLGKSLTNMIPFQKITLRLGSVLKATGREAETSVRRLDRFAVELGNATLTSRQAVLEAAAALATFQNIKTDQFETILTKAQDLSAVFGGDLKSNTILLARALSAPGEAFTILERRVGKFTVAERELLLELQNTGRIAEAQAIIMEKLGSVTGAAAKEAGEAAGASDTLGESIFNLSITLARVTGVAKGFKIAANSISRSIFSIRRALGDIDTLTIEELEKSIAKLEKRLATVRKTSGAFFEQFARKDIKKLEELKKALEELTRGTDLDLAEDKTFEKLTEASRVASQDISKNLATAILESKGNLQSFGSFAENILNRIAQRILEVSITKPLVEGIIGALNIPSVPGFGTPGKALGGPVQARQPVVVGEKGPELFVPNTSGSVVPNNKMGGGGVSIVQNFTIVSGAEINLIDQKIRDAAPIIQQQAMAGTFEAIQKGGTGSQLVGRKF